MGWEDVTLKQFLEIAYLGKPPCEVLLGKTKKEIELMPFADAMNLIQSLAFIETEPAFDMLTEFEHEGEIYEVNNSIAKRTFGQFIDLYNYVEKFKENPLFITQILSVLCLPKGKKYSECYNENDKRAQSLLNAPLRKVYGILIFFLIGSNLYPNDSLLSLLKNKVKNQMKIYLINIKKVSIKNGIGIKFYIGWLMRIYYGLNLFLYFRLAKSLDSFPTNPNGASLLKGLAMKIQRMNKFLIKLIKN